MTYIPLYTYIHILTLIQSIDMCAAVIQRAWFTSKGNYAQFIVAAARRAKEEHLQLLNDNALIIQQNFLGHLWNLLNEAAMQVSDT